MQKNIELVFATPRKLPKPSQVKGRVAVLDVAFASEASGGGFEKITWPFIAGLGNRLAVWVDHHDHVLHRNYLLDPRFVLASKAEHGACPEMVTPEVVARAGVIDSIVCHTDFDGLCSAAKWMLGGIEPYEGADDDAFAIDTRTKVAGPIGMRIDRALRGKPRDFALYGLVVRHLSTKLADASLWQPIDEAASLFAPLEDAARVLSRGYKLVDVRLPEGQPDSCRTLAWLDVPKGAPQYDKTLLLMLGQERAPISLMRDGETVTFAARYGSGINFLPLLRLSGGMPTLVSVPAGSLPEALEQMGVTVADRATFAA